jgi:hypothetical protein
LLISFLLEAFRLPFAFALLFRGARTEFGTQKRRTTSASKQRKERTKQNFHLLKLRIWPSPVARVCIYEKKLVFAQVDRKLSAEKNVQFRAADEVVEFWLV